MSAARVVRRRLAERWRKPALVVGSVVFHAVMLAVLGLQVVEIGEVPPPEPQVVFLDITPRPILKDETVRVRTPPRPEATPNRLTLPEQAAASRALPLRDPSEETAQGLPAAPSSRVGTPAPGVSVPPAAAASGGWIVRPETQGDLVQRGLQASNPACRTSLLPTSAEQARCDERMANASNSTPAIRGSGDPDTDSRFAREGAARLAAYAARREALTPGRPTCPETRSPISDCAVEVKIDIWSSREGFLPRQRADD